MPDPSAGLPSWLKPPQGNPQPDLGLAGENEDITGFYAWRVGDGLSQGLAGVITCQGLRVADLGCGRGRLGFQALALGAAVVQFSDASHMVIDYMQRLIVANALQDRASAVVHAWGGALPGAPHDLILGGDILYRPECFTALLATISASLAPQGTCLLVDPRTILDEDLAEGAAAQGLGWNCTRHADGYTLVRLSHVTHLPR